MQGDIITTDNLKRYVVDEITSIDKLVNESINKGHWTISLQKN